MDKFYKYMAGLHAIGENIGKIALTPNKAVVNSFLTFKITYTAGKKGIKKGGGIKVGIPHAFSAPQVDDPKSVGFVSVKISAPKTKFSVFMDNDMCSGLTQNGHVGSWTKDVFVKIEGGELKEGDKIEIVYGDKSKGGPGAQVAYFTQWFEFTTGVDANGKREAPYTGYYLLPKQVNVATISGPVAAFKVYAPSLVGLKSNFKTKIVPKDNNGNKVGNYNGKPQIICEDGSLRETQKATPQQAGAGTLQSEVRVKTKNESVHRVKVLDRNGIYGISNPVVVKNNRKYNLYWGELHAHTFLTDGLGTIEEGYKYARDVAGLDFFSLADHSNFTPACWKDFLDIADKFHAEGKFATLYGYEVSASPGGDICVYHKKKYDDYYQMKRSADGSYWDIKPFDKLHDFLSNKEALMIPHLHCSHTWNYPADDIRRLVEIYSCWGNHESRGCSYPSRAGDISGYVFDALNKGKKIGITAGSDCHAGHPGDTDWLRTEKVYHGGLTAVYARELTREGIWEALRNRRCYATTGSRIFIDFKINGQVMGAVLKVKKNRNVNIEVMVVGTEYAANVELIKNGQVFKSDLVREWPYPGKPDNRYVGKFKWEDKITRNNWYLVRVSQVDKEMAWSSPIWVEI